jgi:2-dehydropantoate 2-reductase
MIDPNSPITVVGAGAVGGITAAFLSRAGRRLQIVCKHRDIADRAADPGFHITGVRGAHTIRLAAVQRIAELEKGQRLILLATKAGDCLAAARELEPRLHADAVVVAMQNGICEEALAEVLGRRRVIGCVVGWGATMHGPGELEMTSSGEFVIGNIDHTADERLPFLRDMLQAVADTRISTNIFGELYSKLIVNACINSLGAISGLELGRLLSRRTVRRLFIGIMREALAVADATGLAVPPGGGGKLDYYRFFDGDGPVSRLRRHLVIGAVGFKYRRLRSSSLQSLERGRKTEVAFLNGYICRQGRACGVATPLNDAVVEVIEQIEAGRRLIGPANLDDPVFRQ